MPPVNCLDDPSTRLATEVEVTYGYPLFELGSVPPFGGPGGDRTIVDPHVVAKDLSCSSRARSASRSAWRPLTSSS